MAAIREPKRDVRKGHYVTRFLTEAWEFGQRELHFYDFERKCMRHLPSKSLFVHETGTTPAFEERMNRLIETPIAQAAGRLASDGGPDGLIIKDWRLLRALHLMVLLQVTRQPSMRASPLRIDDVLTWSDEKLDQLTAVSIQRHSLVRLRGHPLGPLFYPSHGIFMMPVRTRRHGFDAAICLPLNPRQAFALLPESVAPHDVFDDLKVGEGELLTHSSIGTTAPQVVVHPMVVAEYQADVLAARIEEARKVSLERFEACFGFNKLVEETFRKFGMAWEE